MNCPMMKDADMACPPDIADVVAELLYRGLIRIRAFARPDEENRCFIEADHLHNLPHIINDFRVERLQYYWDVERPLFLRKVPENETHDLAPLWEQLAALMESHGIAQRNEAIAAEK
jgi:hypothetical protein